jgi:hypothetical protein
MVNSNFQRMLKEKIENLLIGLPPNTPAFELKITKGNEQQFTIQFKSLNDTVKKGNSMKINPVGLHDLFW